MSKIKIYKKSLILAKYYIPCLIFTHAAMANLKDDLRIFLGIAVSTGNVEAIASILEIDPTLASGNIGKEGSALLTKDTSKRDLARTEARSVLSTRFAPSGGAPAVNLSKQIDDLKLDAAFSELLKKGDYIAAYQYLMTDSNGAHQKALKAIGANQKSTTDVLAAAKAVKKG